MNHVIEKFGMPIEYKPMQWWFEERTGLFSSRLVVRKLVRHDRGMVEYSFTFTPSDAAKKLHGVFFGQSVTVKMSLRPR